MSALCVLHSCEGLSVWLDRLLPDNRLNNNTISGCDIIIYGWQQSRPSSKRQPGGGNDSISGSNIILFPLGVPVHICRGQRLLSKPQPRQWRKPTGNNSISGLVMILFPVTSGRKPAGTIKTEER